MIDKIKKYILKNPKAVRYQLTTGGSMLVSLSAGIINTVVGSTELSFFLGINGIYNLVITAAKFYAVKKLFLITKTKDSYEKSAIETNACKHIARLVLIMSLINLCFGIVTVFFYADHAEYGLWFMIYSGGFAVFKLFMSIFGAVRTRNYERQLFHFIKLTNLAIAFVSIALAQRVILYYVGYPYANFVSGIGSIVFSFFALYICVLLSLKYRKQSKNEMI